eukprot:2421128-Ditylum_brightwellii.AAC.1
MAYVKERWRWKSGENVEEIYCKKCVNQKQIQRSAAAHKVLGLGTNAIVVVGVALDAHAFFLLGKVRQVPVSAE